MDGLFVMTEPSLLGSRWVPAAFTACFADLVALRTDELRADVDQLAAAYGAGRLAGFFFTMFGLRVHIFPSS
jgi:hypothetical protein